MIFVCVNRVEIINGLSNQKTNEQKNNRKVHNQRHGEVSVPSGLVACLYMDPI
jgi:hypothetical protein